MSLQVRMYLSRSTWAPGLLGFMRAAGLRARKEWQGPLLGGRTSGVFLKSAVRPAAAGGAPVDRRARALSQGQRNTRQ